MAFKQIVFLIMLLASGYAGDLTISYAPSSVRFGQASGLRASSLDDVLAAAMGYTPETSPWTGLTVTSPFKSPSAVIVVGVEGSGSEVLQEGTRYALQEDQDLLQVYGSLHAAISARSQRPTHFQHTEVADSASPSDTASVPHGSSLQLDVEPDASFLLEVGALPALAGKINSSAPHGGQDFIFYQIESYALLVKTYGDDSAQIREGKQLLRSAVGRLVAAARAVYDDQVLVVSVVTDKPAAGRFKRHILQAIGQENDWNLAVEYDEDYPVIFNMILFTSIVLILAILATSVAMATMDPGRDSIIYRMTNPRMKKDQ